MPKWSTYVLGIVPLALGLFSLGGTLYYSGELQGIREVHAATGNKLNLQEQSNGIQVLVNGQPVGFATTFNFVSANGIMQVCTPSGAQVNCTPSYNTAIMVTKGVLQSGACQYLNSTNGTIGYTYQLGPSCQALTVYTKGMRFWLVTDTPCPGACSLNIDNVGLKNIKRSDGLTDPGGIFDFTQGVPVWFDGTVFRIEWQTPA